MLSLSLPSFRSARSDVSRRALVLGARSLIAQALARRLASQGWDLVLAARNSDELEPIAADIALRNGTSASVCEFDALAHEEMASFPEQMEGEIGPFQLVVLVFGYLGDSRECNVQTAEMEKTLGTNFFGAVICLQHLANYLEHRAEPGAGIIGISSVAGDRGRQSNYVYGAAKGGLSLFLQGLRNRLSHSGIHVLTAKPGFVDTPMTEDMEGLFLVATPERVAGDIIRAFERGRDVVYTPWFWRYIMLVIRLIPERVFKKLTL